MVSRYPPRSGGASLEGWEGHEEVKTAWRADTLHTLARPPWMGGSGRTPTRWYHVSMPSSLWRCLHGGVARARKSVNGVVPWYPARFDGLTLEHL
eukprot:5559720-Pyramimonas_sp.AAC.1